MGGEGNDARGVLLPSFVPTVVHFGFFFFQIYIFKGMLGKVYLYPGKFFEVVPNVPKT